MATLGGGGGGASEHKTQTPKARTLIKSPEDAEEATFLLADWDSDTDQSKASKTSSHKRGASQLSSDEESTSQNESESEASDSEIQARMPLGKPFEF
jgi:hypothetical protein